MLEYFDTYAAADGDTTLVLTGVKMMKVPDERYLRLPGVLPDRERMVAYEAADVTIAPASGDLLAQPLLESLAVGTPVLAMEAGGVAEVVRDGVNGLLVPSGDADALAAAVARYFDDDAMRERLRAAAVASVEEYGRDRVFARLEETLLAVARRS
jgi:D-inositol-3-phosphate glycosyltransferase